MQADTINDVVITESHASNPEGVETVTNSPTAADVVTHATPTEYDDCITEYYNYREYYDRSNNRNIVKTFNAFFVDYSGGAGTHRIA